MKQPAEPPGRNQGRLGPDPVIEAYKASIDRTLLRHSLKRSPAERPANLVASQGFAKKGLPGKFAHWDRGETRFPLGGQLVRRVFTPPPARRGGGTGPPVVRTLGLLPAPLNRPASGDSR